MCCSLRLLLTHWGRVTHICVSRLTVTGSDDGLSPGRRQSIIWTNAGILLIQTLGTNFSEMLGKTHSFSFRKMHLKMSFAKGRLFSLGLNVLSLLAKCWWFGSNLASYLQFHYWAILACYYYSVVKQQQGTLVTENENKYLTTRTGYKRCLKQRKWQMNHYPTR